MRVEQYRGQLWACAWPGEHQNWFARCTLCTAVLQAYTLSLGLQELSSCCIVRGGVLCSDSDIGLQVWTQVGHYNVTIGIGMHSPGIW